MSIDKSQKNIKPQYLNFAKRWELICSGKDHAKIANEIGVVPETISDWKRGFRLPEGKYLPKINEYFGVNLDWLIMGNGPKNNLLKTIKIDTSIEKLLEKNIIEKHNLEKELAEMKEKLKPWDGEERRKIQKHYGEVGKREER